MDIRFAVGLIMLAAQAGTWLAIGYFFPPVGAMLIALHVLGIVLEVAANGIDDAEYALPNLIGAGLAAAGMIFSPYVL